MSERPDDPAPVSLTVAIRQSEDVEIQFMIALDNVLKAFAEKLNDKDAFKRVVTHMAEKWDYDFG